MKDANAGFNWSINEDATWPPRGRPLPPFGPTALEVMRSCPLRSCFEGSTGYERITSRAVGPKGGSGRPLGGHGASSSMLQLQPVFASFMVSPTDRKSVV